MKEIIWTEIAQQRHWCAAERWSKAMANSFGDKAEEVKELTEEQKILKRKEQAKRGRDTLLAKNPNHFKELARAKWEQK